MTTGATAAAGSAEISGDGRHICYTLEPGTLSSRIFVIDRHTSVKTRVSVANTGEIANSVSQGCAINADGTLVMFTSFATNLVSGDSNGQPDLVLLRTLFATMELDQTALAFGAVTSGPTFVSQTAAQHVRLTQSGNSTVTWTAVANQPWLQVSPASGTGSGTLSVRVVPAAGVPPSGTVSGTIFVSLTGALNAVPGIDVTLTLTPAGTNLGPFGHRRYTGSQLTRCDWCRAVHRLGH